MKKLEEDNEQYKTKITLLEKEIAEIISKNEVNLAENEKEISFLKEDKESLTWQVSTITKEKQEEIDKLTEELVSIFFLTFYFSSQTNLKISPVL